MENWEETVPKQSKHQTQRPRDVSTCEHKARMRSLAEQKALGAAAGGRRVSQHCSLTVHEPRHAGRLLLCFVTLFSVRTGAGVLSPCLSCGGDPA